MMKRSNIKRVHRIVTVTFFAVTALLCCGMFTARVSAQGRPILLHNGNMEPGMVGRERALMNPRLRGHFQSVELIAPEGAKIWLLDGSVPNGRFTNSGKSTVTVGMMIGEVYRVKVTEIPNSPGEEIFPTIEVINRLYTPGAQHSRFAVPIQIAQDDLNVALKGGYVTRVVYLENPREALPVSDPDGEQQVIDLRPNEDPLHAADEFGRPMAMLRLGSRVPDIVLHEGEAGFGYGAPPLRLYEEDHEQRVPDLHRIEPENGPAIQGDFNALNQRTPDSFVE